MEYESDQDMLDIETVIADADDECMVCNCPINSDQCANYFIFTASCTRGLCLCEY